MSGKGWDHPRDIAVSSGSWLCPVLSSFLALLLFGLIAFAPALEAVDGGGQEEAGHDGHHRHGDAREDDDKEVGEGERHLALAKTVLGELVEGHTAAVCRQRTIQAFHPCKNRDKR